jgi:hypothetical protein
LYYQGHAKIFSLIKAARIARTIAFVEERDWFSKRLRFELDLLKKQAERKGFVPAVRLNLLSDVEWENVFPWVFDYPFQYYDYLKSAKRMFRWCNDELPANYHLTFSRSETNEADCVRVLEAGGNVAVVYRDKDLPKAWKGYKVVNGDKTDLRFLDSLGCVIGLYAKGTAKADKTGFVVDNAIRTPLALI